MKYLWLISLLVLPALLCTLGNGNKLMTFAAEDEIDEEIVENEDSPLVGEDVEDEAEVTTSPDANTFLLFTRPLYTPGVPLELPAGNPVEFLVGFLNNGMDDFVVESVEASFRYPMDFNYYIQNFSAIPYNREIKPGHEATVSYSFIPSDTFAGRPFGLNIALNYRDINGFQFTEAVFNETVQITEIDEGLDGETFFLYVFLAGIGVLLLVVGQQFLVGSVGKRKRAQVSRKTIETGTTSSTDVDYEWLPQETLKALQKASPNSKSPKNSPNGKASSKQSPKAQTQSPRQRKAKAGSHD